MDENETPFYKKPIFWLGLWIVVLIGLYAYQIYTQQTFGSILGVVCNGGLFWLLFVTWMAFYAQFILPVRLLDSRGKIIDRLNRHMSRSHGPALFIKDGRVIAREGELEKNRAGVIWLDSASAAVTRTNTAYVQVLGPGVHFTGDGEYLAGWLDLHTQVQSLGPREGDALLYKLPETADEETKARHKEALERRKAVTALTRDGIELFPNITVVFKIDASPAKGNEPGSRFGYNKDSVEKAIRGEGINPNAKDEASRHVAWNQLPALIAADLWREYAAKFTLNQLFEPNQPALPDIPQPAAPKVITPPPPPPPAKADPVTEMLRFINNRMEKHLQEAESELGEAEDNEALEAESPSLAPASVAMKDSRPKTAMQIISQMVKARMTQTFVPVLDESGRLLDGRAISEEYRKIQDRGIRIISVSISTPRLTSTIEYRTIKEWTTNWLANAKAERKRIDQRTTFVTEDAKQTALKDYVNDLSASLIKTGPADIEAAVKILVERSRNEIIRDDRLVSRMNREPAKPAEQPVSVSPLIDLLRTGSGKPLDESSARRISSELEILDQILKLVESSDL